MRLRKRLVIEMTTTVFIMMVGLPASGKSTYAKKLAKKYNANIHSSDEIREELSGDVNNQNINELVFKTLHNRIKEDLKNGKSCIYDATNISYKRRMAFLDELNRIPCYKFCYLMATPYEECLKNNGNRDRKVPEEVIERMYRNFDVPWYYEGWDFITIEYFKDSLNYYGTIDEWLGTVHNYNQHNSHHKLTLGEHSESALLYMQEKLCTANITSDIALEYATILHDCGKPFCATYTNKKGEITNECHYYDHQFVGAYNSLFYDCRGINPLYIASRIRWHMQPYFNKEEKTKIKYRKLWGENMYRDIMLLHEADKAAH